MKLLKEILNMNYSKRESFDRTQLSEVYGIIYRIYCIPENKSYIGQTFSHNYGNNSYLQRHGMITRCKRHMRERLKDVSMNRPLYKALNTYEPEEFEVYEEFHVHGEDLACMNQYEAEYMEKYDSCYPNGYNVEEVGKRYGKLLTALSEYHNFEIKKHDYVDKTRFRRAKDIMFRERFGLSKRIKITRELVTEKLSTIYIESVRLIDSSGLRMVVSETDRKDNIRVYLAGFTKEEAVEFAKKFSDNLEIGWNEDKFHKKMVKALSANNVTRISGKMYLNKSNGAKTYLLMFHGKKNHRSQTLVRISFGGRTIPIETTYRDVLEFIEKYKGQNKESQPIYDLKPIDVGNREAEKDETP